MKFYLFEIKYWLRQPMVYIFFLINALMIFGATYSENITVGGSFGNIMKNAPFVIQTYYSIMSFITLLMTTSFVLASTTRDFSYNTYQIIFTTPVKRMEYLLGRFLGAVTISVIPLLGVSLGIIIGCMMPGMDPDKIGPFYFQAHLAGFLQLAVPNTLFSASVVFMIAALTRNTFAAFAGSLVLLLATGIADAFAEDLDKEWLAILLDPYGSTTFSILTKYWTVSQKNTMTLGLEGWLLINRLIWLAISSILVLVTVKTFSFTEKSRSAKKSKNIISDEVVRLSVKSLPRVNPSYSSKASRIMFATRLKYELKGILKSPTFLIIMIAGLLNFIPNLTSNTGSFGLTAHPVTHIMIENVQGAFYAFLIAIIIIYSGMLVWRERENKIDEIYDATPHPTHISYLSKFTSLAVIIFIVQTICILVCILVQFAKGFTDIRPEVYIVNLLVIDYSKLLMLVVISMLMHALINNKYLAYFAFITFLLLNTFVWRMLEIESHMVKFSGAPNFIYSDMNGFGPYVAGLTWFRIYWALFCILIIFVTIYAWTRGRETSFRTKMQSILTGFKGARKPVILSILTLWLVTAGFIYYNTQQLNSYQTEEEIESVNIKYEQKYKKYQTAIQPRATAFVYNIDLFPEDRRLEIKGKYWAKNKSNVPIDSLHLTIVPYFTTTITVSGATKILDDKDLQYQILRFQKPLMPGDSILIQFESQYDAKGFENDVAFNSVVDNGSFFNNYDFCPNIGYQPRREIEDRDKRKKHGLPENARLPKLQQNCTEACMSNYITNNSDWVNVETYFSTSEDEIAVAPGSLQKQWKEGNRNFYHYKLDHQSINFYSFISARYEVLRSKHRGIDVEVYYDKRHAYNIKNMESSMKKSLDYYITNFGPYYHKQVRIIEFPKYDSFAQAFPGTMPYSESIGFIAKIEDEDDIDMVFYVVAHEMGHQYWAHQLIGSEMQGATMLSETFAQYSALMVMEKEYGRDAMKKFLKYEMDGYLRSRGSERIKELPLKLVENQGYIHYQKGSLVMYYLKEMIGEKQLNAALQELLRAYAYKEPPYPTSNHAVSIFRSHTPDSLQYIITDLFETITLFSNRAIAAKSKPLSNGKYEVTIETESKKFRADTLGRESETAVNDWIEIGVFAKPEDGKKSGKLLYRKMHPVRKSKNTYTVIVAEKPFEAGIDPINLMIDMVSEDNIAKVKD
ncbi:MAG: hypothetical protein IPN54_01855 [Bacteroidetes bacterium]|nr:hypothetical protein [Bacteroidota bacterium]